MPNDHLNTPIPFSLSRAIDERTQDKEQISTKALPCTVTKIVGELVTVSIDMKGNYTIPNITIPQLFSEYFRQPTQVGDKGWAIPADFYLGGQSGQGGGTANFYQRGNLTPLVFAPISQKKFPHNTSRDPNSAFVNGPNGVIIQDTGGHCFITLTTTTITVTDSYGNSIVMGSTGVAVNPASGKKVFLGGDGSTGNYDFVLTPSGPSTNVKARTS